MGNLTSTNTASMDISPHAADHQNRNHRHSYNVTEQVSDDESPDNHSNNPNNNIGNITIRVNNGLSNGSGASGNANGNGTTASGNGVAKVPRSYEPREQRIITKNVIVIGLAFMIHFTAFHGTSNLQSSVNSDKALGTTTLAVIYGSLILSNIFLPMTVI
ncbi:PREDICTED: probable serine/threonine-protein kinase fhkB, partial [Rhagoletis zephyria]|uniref:probable serine/threonine-protein kinase fhkB n=1 Tax=Rhagoletis zephyria TaxID=28612 RepID=UPI0008115A39